MNLSFPTLTSHYRITLEANGLNKGQHQKMIAKFKKKNSGRRAAGGERHHEHPAPQHQDRPDRGGPARREDEDQGRQRLARQGLHRHAQLGEVCV